MAVELDVGRGRGHDSAVSVLRGSKVERGPEYKPKIVGATTGSHAPHGEALSWRRTSWRRPGIAGGRTVVVRRGLVVETAFDGLRGSPRYGGGVRPASPCARR